MCGASIVDGTVPARTTPALAAYYSTPQGFGPAPGHRRGPLPAHLVAVLVLTVVALILLVSAIFTTTWYVIVDDVDLWDDYRWEVLVGFGLWRVQVVEREFMGGELDWEDTESWRYEDEFSSSETDSVMTVVQYTSAMLIVGLALLVLFLILVCIGATGALDKWIRNANVVTGMVGITAFIVLFTAVAYFGYEFPLAIDDVYSLDQAETAGLGSSFGIAAMASIFLMFAAVFSFKGFGTPAGTVGSAPPYAI